MARQKKQYDGLFDLGFPIHTRVGQDQVKSILYDINERHQARVNRVQDYLSKELDSVGNTTFDKVGRVLNHNAEDLARLKGNVDTRNIAVSMYQHGKLMPIEQRTKQRMNGVRTGRLPTKPCGPPTFPATPILIEPGGAIFCEYDECNKEIIGTFFVPGWHPGMQVSPWGPCQQQPGGGGTIVSQPTPKPQPHLGQAVFETTQPTPVTGSQCPQCGCPLTLDDLMKAPGSSCDKPLYIVLCAPKPRTTCPAPENGGSTGSVATPEAGQSQPTNGVPTNGTQATGQQWPYGYIPAPGFNIATAGGP